MYGVVIVGYCGAEYPPYQGEAGEVGAAHGEHLDREIHEKLISGDKGDTNHIDCEIEAEEEVYDTNYNNKQYEDWVWNVELDDIADDKVCINSNN